MVKEIEIYNNKKILVDFDKVERMICNIFIVFFVLFYSFFPEYRVGLGEISFRCIVFMVVTMTAVLCIIASKILSGNFKLSKYNIILLVYLLCIIISYSFSDYQASALFGSQGRGEGVIPLICYMLCFYIAFVGFKFNDKVFDYITSAVLLLSCFGIFQSLVSDDYTWTILGSNPYMGQANFGNPNMFSSFLMIFLPIYMVKYYNSENKIWTWVLGIMFAAIVGTKTFGGYITFIFVFVVLSIYFLIIGQTRKRTLSKICVLVFMFIAIFVVLNAVNDNAYYGEMLSNISEIRASSGGDVQKFGNNRGFIWKLTLDIISKHPWLGVGPDSLGSEVRLNYMDRDDYLFGDLFIDKAHNEYLQIAATTGIPSLIIYVIFLFTILISLLLKYIKYVKSGKILDTKTMEIVAITGSVVAYMIQAMGNISIFYVAPMFWIVLGIGANISSKKKA